MSRFQISAEEYTAIKAAEQAVKDKRTSKWLHILMMRYEGCKVEARYAALGLIEDFMRSAAGSRKLSAYRDSYHRDFILTVALDEQDKTPVSCTTRELASV